MKKGTLALLCVALIAAVPACKKNNEGKMKKQKTEKKTYSKKNKKGDMVEETTQRMAQPVK